MNEPLSRVARTAVAQVAQPALFLHYEIALTNGRVLSDETFRLVNFEGQERPSEPFEYKLQLHGDTDSSAPPLDFSYLIGRPVSVGIGLPDLPFSQSRNAVLRPRAPDDAPQVPSQYAVFHGMVASFGMSEPGIYQVVMRPTLWRMTLTNNYRMHRQMSVRDVLTSLCREHRVVANFDALAGQDNLAVTRVQDWLQAGESDYEFMRRLMGKAHVFYYFAHAAGQHTVVFANRASYPDVFSADLPLRYTWVAEDELGAHQFDVISQYSFQQSMGCSGVAGVFTQEGQAANVEGGIAQFSSFRARSAPDVGELPFKQYRIYQYGGSNNEVRHYTLASHDALQTANVQLSGSSYCGLFRAGHQFRMSAMGLDVRPQLEEMPYVLTEVQHHASLDGEYTNQFQATQASGLIANVTVQDTQQGALLARVVPHRTLASPGTWPYYTPDNFDMQQQLQSDSMGVPNKLEAKGVYVRFSTDDDNGPTVWVKLAPHMQTVPEVGTMVLVSRANDESELPEIQAIHSDGSSVVTASGWLAHTQVGSNYSTSYGDGKSIRLGTKWSPSIVTTAIGLIDSAYQRGVFRDAGYSRGGSYNYSTSEQIEQGMLGESWSYGCNYGHSWAKESKSFSATGRTYNESVTGDCSTSLNSTEAGDAEALAAVQANKSTVIGKVYNNSTNTGDIKSINTVTGDTVNISTNTGNVTSTSTVTGTSTNDATHGGKVSGTTTINADSYNKSTITGTSTNVTAHNIVNNTTVINAQSSSSQINFTNSNDAIGISNSNSATGVSNRNSATGANVDISIVGIGRSMSMAGSENSIKMVGSQNSLNMIGTSTSMDLYGGGVHIVNKTLETKTIGPDIELPLIKLIL